MLTCQFQTSTAAEFPVGMTRSRGFAQTFSSWQVVAQETMTQRWELKAEASSEAEERWFQEAVLTTYIKTKAEQKCFVHVPHTFK